MRRRRRWVQLGTVLITLLMGHWTQAQAGEAMLTGTVFDTSEALLPGVEISLLETGSGVVRDTISDTLGAFTFVGLSPGTYQLRAALAGFDEAIVEGIVLAIDQEQRVEVYLKVKSLDDQELWVEEPESKISLIEAPLDAELNPPAGIELADSVPESGGELFLRGRIYSDWVVSNTEGTSSQQLSNRVKLEVGAPPGEGWTVRLDFRDRHRMGSNSSTRLVLYDARLTYDSQENPLFLSMGQMNLYDTAGIGQLLGATAGFKPTPNLLVGGYGGFSPDLFDLSLDPGYKKFGFFARYLGPHALNLSVSLNQLQYQGQSERRSLYFNGLAPIGERTTFYGNLEYELGSNIASADRLSRLFLTGRFELTEAIDLTTNFSSGRGLDYHRYLLEQSQELRPINSSMDRFYFSTQYGFRFRFRLPHRIQLFVGQRESEQQDQQVQNHTTQLGFSAQNIAGSGLSTNMGYNLNRGDRSESSSFYLSTSRTFGRFSWNLNYSSSFNSVRIDPTTGLPQLIHIDNLHTISNDLFIVLSRAFAISAQYEHSMGRSVEDLFFFRFLYRM